jgi:hypothetical protein
MPILRITIVGYISATLIIGLVNESALCASFLSHTTVTAILPAVPTETPRDALPTRSRMVLVLFQRAAGVVDLHFILLDGEVRRDEGAGDFAAVGAVA